MLETRMKRVKIRNVREQNIFTATTASEIDRRWAIESQNQRTGDEARQPTFDLCGEEAQPGLGEMHEKQQKRVDAVTRESHKSWSRLFRKAGTKMRATAGHVLRQDARSREAQGIGKPPCLRLQARRLGLGCLNVALT